MLTPTQKRTAQAIVNIFETGSVQGDYSQVTVIPGDPGHLTFGRSQTTLASGNLHDLVAHYCANAGARFGARLSGALARLAARDLALDDDLVLQNVLRASADDPVMRDTQDAFFDRAYWKPAERAAAEIGITLPLGVAVVYDSIVHGSWRQIRDRTNAAAGAASAIGERAWIARYLAERRTWLADNPRRILRATVYRVDALLRLVDQDLWGLDLPLVVRGLEISAATLATSPPNCYDGPQPGSRVLALQSPLARGLDVRLVQLGLSDRGQHLVADGIFGQVSRDSVRAYQAANGLTANGVADIALIHRLAT